MVWQDATAFGGDKIPVDASGGNYDCDPDNDNFQGFYNAPGPGQGAGTWKWADVQASISLVPRSVPSRITVSMGPTPCRLPQRSPFMNFAPG